MTSENEITIVEACSFPPPSSVILSNLGNQLLLDERFYVAVLNLAKQFGYSAIYQRKVIVNPCYLDIKNKCSQSDYLECLGGQFLWKPYSGTAAAEHAVKKNKLNKTQAHSSSITKKILSKRRKAAYHQADEETIRNTNTLGKANIKSVRSSKTVKINIVRDNIKNVHHSSLENNRSVPAHSIKPLECVDLLNSVVCNQGGDFPKTAKINPLGLCRIKK